MHEGNATSAGPDAGRFVHEAIAGAAAGGQRSLEVGHAVADVMDAGSAARQELCDRAVGRIGVQQLHLGLAERQGYDRRTVGVLGGMRREAEDIAVEGERRLEIIDGDTDMGYTGAVGHEASSTRSVTQRMENNGMGTANSAIVHVTDDTFASEVESTRGLTLVDFWATWCGPCQIIAPLLDQLAGEYQGQIKVAKLDVDANQSTSMRYRVRSLPSVLYFKDGKHVDTVVGAVPKTTLDAKIRQHLG